MSVLFNLLCPGDLPCSFHEGGSTKRLTGDSLSEIPLDPVGIHSRKDDFQRYEPGNAWNDVVSEGNKSFWTRHRIDRIICCYWSNDWSLCGEDEYDKVTPHEECHTFHTRPNRLMSQTHTTTGLVNSSSVISLNTSRQCHPNSQSMRFSSRSIDIDPYSRICQSSNRHQCID